MKSDNMIVDHSWENLLNVNPRTKLKKSGLYRAKVIETNDPLNINRLRVNIPEFHNQDLKPEHSPWAIASSATGGRGAFTFVSASIGDWVWVRFEKNDPHVPVYLGFASPTRRGNYSTPQIHTETLPILDEDGNLTESETAYDSDYLPKDGRPMKTGYVDTYGSMDISSAVGYFPSEHAELPAPTSLSTADNSSILSNRTEPPLVNSPDLKYMLRMTKYGMIFLMSDQGYHWKKPSEFESETIRSDPDFDPDGSELSLGEFVGDFAEDQKFESKRWLNLQKLLSEDSPEGEDRRRMMMMTRYGHMFDMRDVGWGQVGPLESKTRDGEYGPPRLISKEEERDQRFIRLRTKAGQYFIMGDRGAHPQNDRYVRKPLLDDIKDQDRELEENWGDDKDARFISLMTRYGWKFLLDDRGSSPTEAEKTDRPRGCGMLIKGRRRPGVASRNSAGKERGFFFQMMEDDKMNSLMLGSPMGHALEMSDKYQYTMLASTMGRNWSSEWKGFKEHEYTNRPMMSKNPERTSHHLKLDHQNEYIRFKTRAGKGRRPIDGIPVNFGDRDINQGFEARDGQQGDGPWVELVDAEHRGIWMSKKENLLILRGKKRKELFIWFDDRTREMSIYNGEAGGKINIYTQGEIEIKSAGDLTLQSDKKINLRAEEIWLESTLGARVNMARTIFYAGEFQKGAQPVIPIQTPKIPKIEPTDRGQTYNGPFEGISRSELSYKIELDEPEN